MSSLTKLEKRKLELLFGMRTGYVLNFSDASFGEFFLDHTGINIHSDDYTYYGTSKAKKLRAFWDNESDPIVGGIVNALIDQWDFICLTQKSRNQEDEKVADQCRAIARRLLSGKVDLSNLKKTANTFNSQYLTDQIKRMELAIETDPILAIGTAKELIETCCKTILRERNQLVDKSPKLPKLVRQTMGELNLVPDDIPNEKRGSDIIKAILGNLAAVGHGMAELRGLYGTGHGQHAKTSTLKPRHARLAVGAATTLVTFLFETHKMENDK